MPTNKQLDKRTLLNGCSRSAIKVIPKNWKESKSNVNKPWQIYYRFYDPLFRDRYPTGKLIPIKGMNQFKDRGERQAITEELLKNELVKIDDQAFNPITGTYMSDPETTVFDTEIPTDTEMCLALDWAFNRKIAEPHTKECIKSCKKYFVQAAKELRLSTLPIDKLRRSHVLMILAQVGKNKGSKWTANNFNNYLAHLSMLFLELIENCIIDVDPTDKIKKQKVVRKKRKILSQVECELVDNHLRKNDFRFWVLMNIFYEAGCRRTEIVSIKGKDVDMNRQIFTALVKKGSAFRLVEYTITDRALYFWRIALQDCKPSENVFSSGLKPGEHQVLPEYLTKRWKRMVKNPVEEGGLGIDVDWYALKHLRATRVSKSLGTAIAASLNNETEKMIIEHYDVEYDDREHERKKSINIPFVKG